MDMKAFEVTTKMIIGEDVTDEEKSYARNYNAKYAIVRHLVMEKMQQEKLGLTNFQFSTGEDFMKTPTVDVVNSIIKTFAIIAEPVSFGDSRWIGNPPQTNQPKTTLG